MDIQAFLHRLARDYSFREQIYHVQELAERPATFAEIEIEPRVKTALEARGIRLSYSRSVRKPGVPEGKPYKPEDYTTEYYKTDAQGVFSLGGLQQTGYGVWVIAPGYGTRFAAAIHASPQEPAPETTIELERTGVLVLRPLPEALKGVPNPHLAYRVCDAAGRPVYPGGEISQTGPDETGVAKLFGKERPEWRIDTIPPGRYTVEWEIHQYPELDEQGRSRLVPAVHRGKAGVGIRKGEETVLPLVPGSSRQLRST